MCRPTLRALIFVFMIRLCGNYGTAMDKKQYDFITNWRWKWFLILKGINNCITLSAELAIHIIKYQI